MSMLRHRPHRHFLPAEIEVKHTLTYLKRIEVCVEYIRKSRRRVTSITNYNYRLNYKDLLLKSKRKDSVH